MDVTVVIVVDLEHLVAYEDGKANTECAFEVAGGQIATG